MYSIGLSMQLKPGSYEGYKEAHDNLWPEIAKSMDDNECEYVDLSLRRPLYFCTRLRRPRRIGSRVANTPH